MGSRVQVKDKYVRRRLRRARKQRIILQWKIALVLEMTDGHIDMWLNATRSERRRLLNNLAARHFQFHYNF